MALLCCSFLLAAQTPPNTKSNEKCSLQGQVVDFQTGVPLVGVSLTLEGQQPRKVSAQPSGYKAISDAIGNFVFDALDAGGYRIVGERTGYVTGGKVGARGTARTLVVLEPGQHSTGTLLRMTRQGVVNGRVVDQDGEPVQRVRVQAMRYFYLRSKRQLVPASDTVTTNDLGEYRLFGLAPGRQYIAAVYPRADPQLRPADSQRPVFIPTLYPASPDAEAATPLDIIPGADLQGINLTLLKRQGARLRGKLTGGNCGQGAAMPNGVSLRSQEPARNPLLFQFFAPVDSQGEFRFDDVLPGLYLLVAGCYDGKKNYTAAESISVGNENIDNITLAMGPTPEFTARVRVEGKDGEKLSGVEFELWAEGTGVGSATTPEGGLSLTLNPGHYALRLVKAGEGFYLKSASLGGQDLLKLGVDVLRGAVGPAELVLSRDAGRMDGVVQTFDGEAVGGATVVLAPLLDERDQTRFFRSTITDQKGRFSIRDIPPHRYALFAWDDIEGSAYLDPEFMTRFESSGQSIEIHERGTDRVQLKLITAQSAQR